jgi:hypothetical protein
VTCQKLFPQTTSGSPYFQNLQNNACHFPTKNCDACIFCIVDNISLSENWDRSRAKCDKLPQHVASSTTNDLLQWWHTSLFVTRTELIGRPQFKLKLWSSLKYSLKPFVTLALLNNYKRLLVSPANWASSF